MSDKDDLIVAGVNQKDKGIWRDFYDRYYAALCSYVEKIGSVRKPCGYVKSTLLVCII